MKLIFQDQSFVKPDAFMKASTQVTQNDPLSAIPHIPADVESVPAKDGGLILYYRIPSTFGFWKKIKLAVRMKTRRSFTLDRNGRFFWERIDGKSNLRQIHKQLSRHISWQDEDSRKAIISFTAVLMQHGLIILEISKKEEAGDE